MGSEGPAPHKQRASSLGEGEPSGNGQEEGSMLRPIRKVDDGAAAFEVGAAVQHRPTGYRGVVTCYVSPAQRTVDWRQVPPGDDVPTTPDPDQDVAQLKPVDAEAVPEFVPPLAQALISRFQLAEREVANPLPRPGERTVHRQAIRLWTGTALGCDDGYDFITAVDQLGGWRTDPGFGDWPQVVEYLRVHDPKEDPEGSGRFFRYYRLTYLERSVYLAEYAHLHSARQDAAWLSAE
jgi:hypothetical protein